jgi:general L-amino acid transport system substrate-binding protein
VGRLRRWAVFGIGCALLGLLHLAPARAESGDTLQRVRQRGALRCGVSEGRPGFSEQSVDGTWRGLDADFCRAVAAAALGTDARVVFVKLSPAERFPALQTGEIDLLARDTTWTVEREASFAIIFAGVVYYDSQGLLMRSGGAGKSGNPDGARICAVNGSNHVAALQAYARAQGWHIVPVLVRDRAGAAQALFSGSCDGLTADLSDLQAIRLQAARPAAYTLRTETISLEPLAPAVRWDDGQWLVLVRAVHAALVNAEIRGLTQAMTDAMGPVQRQFVTDTGSITRALGLYSAWGLQVVRVVGNYGEMFERDLGSGSALKLDRGHNRLWTQGGSIYAPPFQ